MKLSARVLSVFATFFILFLLFLAPKNSVLAQTNSYLTPNVESGVPKNLHTYTQGVFIDVLSTSLCYLAGVDPVSPNHKCLGWDSKTHKIGYVEAGNGAIGAMTGLISYMYTPPTSSSQYIGYLSRNFGITDKAYAADSVDCRDPKVAKQGYGFCVLEPLTQTWIAMRDIVYLLLVVIFIVIGVAIMLRVHIDPRTVMTIENQIPKIIIAIVLVTFSLAIAGFLIDVMYISIFLIGNIINSIPAFQNITLPTSSPYAGQTVNFASVVTASNPFDAINKINPIGGFGDIATNMTYGVLNVIGITADVHSGLLPLLTGDPIGFLVGIVVIIVLFLGLLFALIRVWMSLVVAYVSILLDVIFSPFWFLAGLVPGATIGTSGWFKDILANLAVFPTVIAMFSLGVIFAHLTQVGSDLQFFNPPMVSPMGNNYLGGIIEFGFIYMTPHALTIVKNAIKAPKLDLGPVFEPAASAGATIKQTVSGFGRAGIAGRYDPYRDEKGKARTGRIIGALFR